MVSLPTHTAAPPELLMELSSDQPPSGQSSDCFGHPLAASSQTAWPTAAHKTSTNKVGFSFIASTYFKALVTIYRSLNTELPYQHTWVTSVVFNVSFAGCSKGPTKMKQANCQKLAPCPPPSITNCGRVQTEGHPKQNPSRRGKRSILFSKRPKLLAHSGNSGKLILYNNVPSEVEQISGAHSSLETSRSSPCNLHSSQKGTIFEHLSPYFARTAHYLLVCAGLQRITAWYSSCK